MDITLSCKNCNISAFGYKNISVELSDVDEDEILGYISTDKINSKVNINDMLDEVDYTKHSDKILDNYTIDEIIYHFGIDAFVNKIRSEKFNRLIND